MAVNKVTYHRYSVKAQDALGRHKLTAADLRALVRSLDAENVPDEALWNEGQMLTQGRLSGEHIDITFQVDEELDH